MYVIMYNWNYLSPAITSVIGSIPSIAYANSKNRNWEMFPKAIVPLYLFNSLMNALDVDDELGVVKRVGQGVVSSGIAYALLRDRQMDAVKYLMIAGLGAFYPAIDYLADVGMFLPEKDPNNEIRPLGVPFDIYSSVGSVLLGGYLLEKNNTIPFIHLGVSALPMIIGSFV